MLMGWLPAGANEVSLPTAEKEATRWASSRSRFSSANLHWTSRINRPLRMNRNLTVRRISQPLSRWANSVQSCSKIDSDRLARSKNTGLLFASMLATGIIWAQWHCARILPIQ
jgi:hypothetical protein